MSFQGLPQLSARFPSFPRRRAAQIASRPRSRMPCTRVKPLRGSGLGETAVPRRAVPGRDRPILLDPRSAPCPFRRTHAGCSPQLGSARHAPQIVAPAEGPSPLSGLLRMPGRGPSHLRRHPGSVRSGSSNAVQTMNQLLGRGLERLKRHTSGQHCRGVRAATDSTITVGESV